MAESTWILPSRIAYRNSTKREDSEKLICKRRERSRADSVTTAVAIRRTMRGKYFSRFWIFERVCAVHGANNVYIAAAAAATHFIITSPSNSDDPTFSNENKRRWEWERGKERKNVHVFLSFAFGLHLVLVSFHSFVGITMKAIYSHRHSTSVTVAAAAAPRGWMHSQTSHISTEVDGGRCSWFVKRYHCSRKRCANPLCDDSKKPKPLLHPVVRIPFRSDYNGVLRVFLLTNTQSRRSWPQLRLIRIGLSRSERACAHVS